MKMTDKLISAFGFDEPDERFELPETESGSLDPFGGWTDIKRRKDCGNKRRRLSRSIKKNEELIRGLFRSDVNPDVIFRRFTARGGTDVLLVYMNGMAKDEKISEFILHPLMNGTVGKTIDIERLTGSFLEIPECEIVSEFDELVSSVADGKSVLLVDGDSRAAVLETRGYESRSVTETDNEKIVHGPKEGFTENLRTNITLVRRIIRRSDLTVKYCGAGGENNTKLALAYIDGLCNPLLIGEIDKRISKMSSKLITSTGMIDQFIEGSTFSPYPQSLSTERPDRTASFIMQGSVALLSEGSPFALILPATLPALLSSPEDTYLRRPLGSLIRVVRYTGSFVSILLPGYFVALAMYHQGMLSTEVLSTVIKSREMVFEPLPFEMILLLFIFQLIREAGMRVPSSVGQAIGVIGGLILGQAAVAANLASTVILIIVAISGLGNLCIPDYSTQIAASYFRFAFVISAWMGGLLGLACSFMLFIAYLANLKSFGVPFLAPFAPKTSSKRPFILRGSIGRHLRAEDYLNTADDKKVRREA